MINSIKFLLIIIMTLCGALGGTFFKKSSTKNNKINSCLILGAALYTVGAILNIILLKYIPLTILFPCNSITYIWTTLIAKYIFNENITIYNLLGMSFITLGLCFLYI